MPTMTIKKYDAIITVAHDAEVGPVHRYDAVAINTVDKVFVVSAENHRKPADIHEAEPDSIVPTTIGARVRDLCEIWIVDGEKWLICHEQLIVKECSNGTV